MTVVCICSTTLCGAQHNKRPLTSACCSCLLWIYTLGWEQAAWVVHAHAVLCAELWRLLLEALHWEGWNHLLCAWMYSHQQPAADADLSAAHVTWSLQLQLKRLPY